MVAPPKNQAGILNQQFESTWTKRDKEYIPTPDDTGINVTEEMVSEAAVKAKLGFEVIKYFSCSTQLNTEFQLLIKLKC